MLYPLGHGTGNIPCNCLQGVRELLSAIPYSSNDIYLHTDASLMPKLRSAWASWNFLGTSDCSADATVCCTYWLNRLQHLPPDAPDTFVTLNPLHLPNPDKVLRQLELSHPQFSYASQQAQQALASVQVRQPHKDDVAAATLPKLHQCEA